MTAKEARRLAAIGANQELAEWRKQQTALKTREREAAKVLSSRVKPFIKVCVDSVRSACSRGHLEVKIPLLGHDARKVAKLASPSLNRLGYKTCEGSETVFTAVDCWEERYYLRIKWQK